MFKHENSPRLIYVEGFDGSGKTTATSMVEQLLRDKGLDVVCVNILKTNPEALVLRTLLTDKKTTLHPQAELFTYLAAVSNSYYCEVEPALREGKVVLCDRGPMSSLVYQANAFAVFNSALPLIHSLAFKDTAPAHNVLVLADEALCDARINSREKNGPDRIESRDKSYRDAVIQSYVKEHAVLVDENQSVHYIYNTTTLEALKSSCEDVVSKILEFCPAP